VRAWCAWQPRGGLPSPLRLLECSPVYFAFYFPFSYTDCQRLLDNIDRALPAIGAVTPRTALPPPPGAGERRSSAGGAGGTGHSQAHAGAGGGSQASPDAVYYARELVALTPDGRRVELLTITSRHGMTHEREGVLEGLFPKATLEPRPHRFRGKPGIFVSARVHPGETASSYMVHGLIAFLLQPRNPYAKALRSAFVFKIMPMLNPDGVARGHFRLDQFGVNLNRLYGQPSPRVQPSIFAAKSVLRQMATLCAPVAVPAAGRATRVLNHSGNGLFMYFDLHAFSAKQGCYLLGNHLPPHKLARSLTFAHLVQLYAPQFNAFASGEAG